LNLPPPWSEHPAGLIVSVRLTPRASRDEIEGIGQLSDGSQVLRICVRAVPEKGKANRALLEILARAAQIAPSCARMASGTSSRRKTIILEGDAAAMIGALKAKLTAKS
jgi:uncharacterized protein YggU (UPF0235/DUF167 family)